MDDHSLIFKTVEDETAKFGIRITNAFKDATSKAKFRFDDRFTDDLKTWSRAIERVQLDLNNIQNADLNSLKAKYLSGAPLEVKEFADNFDFLNGKVSDFSVQMKQSALATAASEASFKQIRGLINTFNHDLSSMGLTQEQWADGVSKTNKVLGAHFKTVKVGEASFGGYIKQLIKSKVATIGMEVATMALNAAISMGVSLLISFAISALDKFIHSATYASEKANELAEQRKEEANSAREEAKSIDELISRYQELAKNENRDADTNAEIRDIQNQITELVGHQANNLDLVNGKLDEQLGKLQAINREADEQVLNTAMANYNAQIEASKKAVGEDKFILDGFDYAGKGDDRAEQILRDAGFGYSLGGAFGTTTFLAKYDFRDGSMKELDTASKKIAYLNDALLALKEGLGSDYAISPIVIGLSEAVAYYDDYAIAVETAANSALNAVIDYTGDYNAELSNITVDSLDSFNAYKDTMVKAVTDDVHLAAMIADGILSPEDIETAVIAWMSTLEEFTVGYNAWKKSQQQEAEVGKDIPRVSFAELMGEESKYRKATDAYIEQKKKLEDAKSKIGQEGFEDAWNNLIPDFPELSGQYNNAEKAIDKAIDALTGHGTIYDVYGNVKEAATGVTAAIEDAYKQIKPSDIPALAEHIEMSLGITDDIKPVKVDDAKIKEYISSVKGIYSGIEDGISSLDLYDLALKYPELKIDWAVSDKKAIVEAERAASAIIADINKMYSEAISSAESMGDTAEADRLRRENAAIVLSLIPQPEDFKFDDVSGIRETIHGLQDSLTDLINGELDNAEKSNLIADLFKTHSKALLEAGITDLNTDNLEEGLETLINVYKQQMVEAFDVAIAALDPTDDAGNIAMLENARDAFIQSILANAPQPDDFEFAADKISGYISDIESVFGSLEDGITRRELMDLSLKFPDLKIDFTVPGDQMEAEAQKAINALRDKINAIYDEALRAATDFETWNRLHEEKKAANIVIDGIGIDTANDIDGIKDIVDEIRSGAGLLKDAQQELHDAGENSLDTISSLYNRFGEKAAGMYSITGGKYIIDTQKIKDELYKQIDELQNVSYADKYMLKAALEIELETEAFDTIVDDHVGKINTLQDALEKVRGGEMDDSAIYSLISEFPKLATRTDDLDTAINELIDSMNTDIIKSFDEQIANCDTDAAREELEALRKVVLNLGKVAETASLAIDIEVETKGIESLNTAIEASASEAGMSADSVEALINRYKDLPTFDMDKLFQQTSIGIRVNADEAQRLEQAYQKIQKTKLENSLRSLQAELARSEAATNGLVKGTEEYAAALGDLREADAIQKDIDNTSILIGQYDGLTSAYYRWQQAKSGPDKGSEYDAIRDEKENVDDLAKRGAWGSEYLQSWVDLISNQDMAGMSPEEYAAEYKRFAEKIPDTKFSINDFFAADEKGPENFLKALSQANSEFATFNKETQKWTLNGSAEQWAEELGVSVEFVETMMDKLQFYGFTGFEFDTDPLDTLNTDIENAETRLDELSKSRGIEIEPLEIDITDPETSIEACQQQIKDLQNNSEIDLEVKTAQIEDAEAKLRWLVYSTKQPQFMSINVEQVDAGLQDLLTKCQEYQDAVNELNYLKLNPNADQAKLAEAQTKVDTIATEIAGLDKEVLAQVGLEFAEGSDIEAIRTELATADFPVNITPLQQALEAEGIVNWKNNDAAPVAFKYVMHQASGEVNWTNNTSAVDTYKKQTHKAYGKVYWTNSGSASSSGDGPGIYAGTAHAAGTAGYAFKSGYWGIDGGGTALGGELGQELVVRDGRFFTIGDNGAEFFKYQPGDIVFNHLQTKDIFAHGKISSRGRALAYGNIYQRGTVANNATGGFSGSGSGSNSSSGGNNKPSSSSSSSSSSGKKGKEIVDWIEIAIDRLERVIDKLAKTAESSFKTLANRLRASKKQIDAVMAEIQLQQQAYDAYMAQAESVKLSEDLKEKVRNGDIDISKYDEKTKKKIEEYQEWYEKALACSEAIDDLKETLSELYADRFDAIATDFDNQLSLYEHQISTFNNELERLESSGYMSGAEFYEALQEVERQKIAKNKEKLRALTQALNDAVQSGMIEVGSEAWYEMQNEINSTTEAIQESENAVLDYANAIRDLKWEQFDFLQEQIGQIATEAGFLISLLENSDLFDENGSITDAGNAALALHGINYNTYMEQANAYAEELKRIEEELAKDPYNTDLIARRNELLGLQQDAITAAEDEKQAIIDLVSQGIQAELDALKELIDAYNESLDSAKDLYDYQKKVRNQTSEIAKLQKQLAAYSGDTSEEGRARIQQLQEQLAEAEEALEETQYDQYIKDQKDLLDDLYEAYEETLNQRLDDVDALIEEVVDSVNSNSGAIAETIQNAASDVGYDISDALEDALLGEGSMVALYTQGMADRVTAIGNTIDNIAKLVEQIVEAGVSKPTSSTDGGTNANAQGYSKGGYVAELQKIAMRNGDDVVTINTLKRGEAVLTSDQAVQFSKLVNSLPVLHKMMNGGYTPITISGVAEGHGGVQCGDINVTIPIDHVQDYNDFVSQIQGDERFERFIKSITLDRMIGGSKLSKYKQKWD